MHKPFLWTARFVQAEQVLSVLIPRPLPLLVKGRQHQMNLKYKANSHSILLIVKRLF